VHALIERQLDLLFVRDARGDLLAVRDASRRPAPRLFLGRSAEGNVWAFRAGVEPALREELAELLDAEPRPIALRADDAPRCRSRVRALLAPVEAEHRGPAYVLDAALPCDGRAREIEPSERDAWSAAFPWLAAELEAVAPVAIAFERGEPAAICHSARGLGAHVAEAGVETLEAFRGRGLATAAVACWARAVRRRGRAALYSTAWDNEASQGVARRLAARLYGENWSVG
jgi:RimJ/RimL family protein N-acetyltransferase